MRERVYLCLAHMSGNEMQYIQEAFDTNWVVPLGPNVNAFEKDLEDFVGNEKRVVVLSSGTAALHLGLIALGVGVGDEVICQSFTFAASCNPVKYLGGTPVFVDSERDTWNMDPALLREAIEDRIRVTGKKPKAIIPVYLYGMPAKMDEIIAIAKEYDIPILEDAAEGLGSRYNGRLCGTLGEFGALSFNGNKMITTSGGGALICPDEATHNKVMYYATQAREPLPYYLHKNVGYNYRMSNICAGIGRGQMTILEDHIAHHKHICDLYVELLQDVKGIKVHTNPNEKFDSNYWLNTITIAPLTGVTPDMLRVALDVENIESRPLWKPMHTQPVYADAPRYLNGVSEDLFSKGLCLPSGPCVSDEDVRRIVTVIRQSMNA